MSASLLLALLEAHEDKESDLSRDYFAWIGAKWDGVRWVGGSPAREELIMRELYDILQSAIYSALSEPEKKTGMIGTVLARALTDHPESTPPDLVRELRTAMKPVLHERFKLLIKRHPPFPNQSLGAQTA